MGNECSLCGGALTLLGRLGNWFWFRCRACGADQHRDWDVLDISEDDVLYLGGDD